MCSPVPCTADAWSILIGLGSALGAAVIGVLLGRYGGYKGGLFDKIVLRLSEIFMSFPQLILVMMLGTIFGRGLWNLIFIFILTGWGGVYRQARAKNALLAGGGEHAVHAGLWPK